MSENIFRSFSGIAGPVALVAHTFGKRDLATKKIVVAGDGEQPDGVIHDDFDAGRAATLDLDGYPLRVKAGVGGVAAGDIGMVGAGGTVVAWASGNYPAVYVHTAAAEGVLAEVELLGRRSFGPPVANIAAPAGGATVDAEARAAIVSILAGLDAHKLTQ